MPYARFTQARCESPSVVAALHLTDFGQSRAAAARYRRIHENVGKAVRAGLNLIATWTDLIQAAEVIRAAMLAIDQARMRKINAIKAEPMPVAIKA